MEISAADLEMLYRDEADADAAEELAEMLRAIDEEELGVVIEKIPAS